MRPTASLLALSLIVVLTAASPCILHIQDSHGIQAANDAAFQRYVMCVQLDLKIQRMNSYGVQLYVQDDTKYSELAKKVTVQVDGIQQTLRKLNSSSSTTSQKNKLKLMDTLGMLQEDGEEIISELNSFLLSQFQMPKNKRSWNAIEGKFANNAISSGMMGDRWEQQIQSILVQFFNEGLDLFETYVFLDDNDEEIVAIGQTALQNMKYIQQSIVDVEAMLRDDTKTTEDEKKRFLSYSSRATAEMKRTRSNIDTLIQKVRRAVTAQGSASLRSEDV